MKNLLVILASVLLVLGIVGVAWAADQQKVQASATVPGVLSIAVSNATLTFGPVIESVTPYTPTEDPIKLTIDANKAWTVKGEAPAQFTPAGGGSLASSNLEWSDDAGVNWHTYPTAPGATIDSGTYVSGHPVDLNHQLTIPHPTDADTYTLDITYKIV